MRMLALCVVFCTTYMLVLPAITMQSEPICGLNDHIHSEECWSRPRTALQNCGIGEGLTVLHQHSGLCKNEGGELICSLAEKSLHTHEAACLVAGLDLSADVENEKDWMRSVSGMTVTGN